MTQNQKIETFNQGFDDCQKYLSEYGLDDAWYRYVMEIPSSANEYEMLYWAGFAECLQNALWE